MPKGPPVTRWASEEAPHDPWDTAKARKDATHLTTVMKVAADQPKRPLSTKSTSPYAFQPKGTSKAPLPIRMSRPKTAKCGLNNCARTIDPRVSITGSKGKGSNRRGTRLILPHGPPTPQKMAFASLRKIPKNRFTTETTQTTTLDRVTHKPKPNAIPADIMWHNLSRHLNNGIIKLNGPLPKPLETLEPAHA